MVVWRYKKEPGKKEELLACHKFNVKATGNNMMEGMSIMDQVFNESKGEPKQLKKCLVVVGSPPLDFIFIQIKEFR